MSICDGDRCLGRQRGPVAQLGRRELGSAPAEGRPAGVRGAHQEPRHPSGSAAAHDGRKLAEARDAVRRPAVGRHQHAALRRGVEPHRISGALPLGDGTRDRAAGRRSRERAQGPRLDERQRRRVRARPSLLAARRGLVRRRHGVVRAGSVRVRTATRSNTRGRRSTP